MDKKYLLPALEALIFAALIFAAILLSGKSLNKVNQVNYLKNKCSFNRIEAYDYYANHQDEVTRLNKENLCPKHVPQSSKDELERLNATTQKLVEDNNKQIDLLLSFATKISQSNIENDIKLQKLNLMLKIIQNSGLSEDISSKISTHINNLVKHLTK